MKQNKKLISAAVLGLMSMAIAPLAHAEDAASAKGECHGVNTCKGTGECGGKGNGCAGKNSCKGTGWKTMTKADCEKAKGTFKESGAAHAPAKK